MEESEVLTRDKAIPHNVLPTGRKVGIVPVKGSGMVTIAYVDNKQGGSIPDRYTGRYTGLSMANKDLKKFVTEFWDLSDSSQKKKPLADAVRR
jgi:hypothetical protein